MKTHAQVPLGALISLLWLGVSLNLPAQVPQLLHYQGRAVVSNTNFEGTGQFKFALVDQGSSPVQATANSMLTPIGQLGIISVIEPGLGYVTAPSVTLTGGGGFGAAAHAVVANGEVSAIVIDNPGFG